jgi:hypothetical protein
MKSYICHYKNKYPSCQIKASEDSLDVYSEQGHHLVSLAKNGAGQIVDRSEEMGCFERHDLSPIPKDARCFKLYSDGKIAPAEEYQERAAWVKEHKKESAHGYYYIEAQKA